MDVAAATFTGDCIESGSGQSGGVPEADQVVPLKSQLTIVALGLLLVVVFVVTLRFWTVTGFVFLFCVVVVVVF